MPDPKHSVIQPFIDTLRYEKRYSPHTIRSYQDDLVQFFNYLNDQFGHVEITEISPSFVRSWLASLKDKKLTARTINRKLSSLKSFFKYLLRNEVLQVTPMTNLVAPRVGKRLPNYVQQKDMPVLLNQAEFPVDWKGKTDSIILNIFYHTGMRLSELVNLKEAHIDAGNQALKVLGKGNKERIIPLSTELLRKIRDYQADKRKEFEQFDHIYLLVNKKGKQLYSKYVYLVVHAYLGKATTLEKASPHVLRHTFATHLTNNGAALNAVKELLGHSSLASTQVYTHNTIQKLKDIHTKAHPKA